MVCVVLTTMPIGDLGPSAVLGVATATPAADLSPSRMNLLENFVVSLSSMQQETALIGHIQTRLNGPRETAAFVVEVWITKTSKRYQDSAR